MPLLPLALLITHVPATALLITRLPATALLITHVPTTALLITHVPATAAEHIYSPVLGPALGRVCQQPPADAVLRAHPGRCVSQAGGLLLFSGLGFWIVFFLVLAFWGEGG